MSKYSISILTIQSFSVKLWLVPVEKISNKGAEVRRPAASKKKMHVYMAIRAHITYAV